MTYVPALIVAAAGVVLLALLALRLFVVLRRFRAVTTTVIGDIRHQTDALQVRRANVKARLIERRAANR
jgi:hypothetical protein